MYKFRCETQRACECLSCVCLKEKDESLGDLLSCSRQTKTENKFANEQMSERETLETPLTSSSALVVDPSAHFLVSSSSF